MKKTFKYHKSLYLLLLIFFVPLLYITIRFFLYESLLVENAAYTILSISLLLIIFYCLIRQWSKIKTVIEITTDRITIRTPFKTTSLKWIDIFEFGRISSLGFKRFYWSFYIKGRGIDDKKIIVATEDIEEVKALIAIIIRKAINAKLVTVHYSSVIPILSKELITDWDRNEYLSKYLN